MRRTSNTKATNNLEKKESFQLNPRVKNILGVFLLFFAFYLLVSFISFLISGGLDQSTLDIPTEEFIENSEIQVENLGGKQGISLSETLINKGVGLSAFGFIFLVFLYALA
ncbi:MAG: DNA translocase FtsK 4TM domain-containing protein, partial [Flavobacteriaceae bacterium]|nr:DNA translocase FtsK 4TM domain-containing protein [Flavobacteriaceae bacterium]